MFCPGKILSVGLRVGNLARAREFYGGLGLRSRAVGAGVEDLLLFGEARLRLHESPSAPPTPAPTPVASLSITSLAAVQEKLTDLKAQSTPPEEGSYTNFNGHTVLTKSIRVTDPDGNVLELVQETEALREGVVVKCPDTRPFPEPTPKIGKTIDLVPFNLEAHARELFDASHGTEEKESVWRYMLPVPHTFPEFREAYASKETSKDPQFYTIINKATGKAAGIASFMSIVPVHQRIEIGHIWIAKELQKTKASAEMFYLFTRHAFEDLGYRRMEWKTNARNQPSRTAALRLGFAFEGIFRQHLPVAGCNRDTAWYALMDHEWAPVKANCEGWLYGTEEEQAASLSGLNALTRLSLSWPDSAEY